MSKLDAKACGLACGILWGGTVLFMGLTAMVCSWAKPFVGWLSTIMYLGYDVTIVGSLIGTVWGFVDGFIGGFLFAWLYNKLAK